LQLKFYFIAADNKLLEVSKFLSKKGVISFTKNGEWYVSLLKSCENFMYQQVLYLKMQRFVYRTYLCVFRVVTNISDYFCIHY